VDVELEGDNYIGNMPESVLMAEMEVTEPDEDAQADASIIVLKRLEEDMEASVKRNAHNEQEQRDNLRAFIDAHC
jgi:hypothetical protein